MGAWRWRLDAIPSPDLGRRLHAASASAGRG
jgi:hypothetical protein